MIIDNCLELRLKFMVKLVRSQSFSLIDKLEFVFEQDIKFFMHIFHEGCGFIFSIVQIGNNSEEHIFSHAVEF